MSQNQIANHLRAIESQPSIGESKLAQRGGDSKRYRVIKVVARRISRPAAHFNDCGSVASEVHILVALDFFLRGCIKSMPTKARLKQPPGIFWWEDYYCILWHKQITIFRGNLHLHNTDKCWICIAQLYFFETAGVSLHYGNMIHQQDFLRSFKD